MGAAVSAAWVNEMGGNGEQAFLNALVQYEAQRLAQTPAPVTQTPAPVTQAAFDEDGNLMPGIVNPNASPAEQAQQLAAHLQSQGLGAAQASQLAGQAIAAQQTLLTSAIAGEPVWQTTPEGGLQTNTNADGSRETRLVGRDQSTLLIAREDMTALGRVATFRDASGQTIVRIFEPSDGGETLYFIGDKTNQPVTEEQAVFVLLFAAPSRAGEGYSIAMANGITKEQEGYEIRRQRLSYFEAVDHWQNGLGMDIRVPLSSLDLSKITDADFPGGLNSSRSFNLLRLSGTDISDQLTYGNITLKLVSPGVVEAALGHDRYDFDLKTWSTETLRRNLETLAGGLVNSIAATIRNFTLAKGNSFFIQLDGQARNGP